MVLSRKFLKILYNFTAGLVLAAMVSGCSSSRFQDNTPIKPIPPSTNTAPLGTVSQADLPPLSSGTMSADEAAGLASLSSSAASEPMGAMDLTPASVAGVWRANLGGMNCQLATPQTKAGKGYRAGALQCPAVFAQLGSWNINGKQLIFYDKSGKSLATLYSTGSNGFSGRTNSGMPVVLSR